MSVKYKRVIIKISGEALAGENKMGFDQSVISKVYINKIVGKEELDLTIVYKIEEF